MKRENNFLGLMLKLFIFNIYLFLFFNSSISQTPFHKYYKNPIIVAKPGTFYKDAAAPGKTIKENGVHKMWFGGGWIDGLHTGYATSSNGINWTKYNDPATTDSPFNESDPVLDVGPPGSWNEGAVFTPMVIYGGTTYHMWFSGRVLSYDHFRIGYAT